MEIKLPKWWLVLASLALAVAPLAVGLPLPLTHKRMLYFSPYDGLIWLAAISSVLWFLLKNRGALFDFIKRWISCCWPGMLIVIISIASIAGMDAWDRKSLILAVKSVFQLSEYLLVTPFVFLLLLDSRDIIKKRVYLFYPVLIAVLFLNYFLAYKEGAFYQTTVILCILWALFWPSYESCQTKKKSLSVYPSFWGLFLLPILSFIPPLPIGVSFLIVVFVMVGIKWACYKQKYAVWVVLECLFLCFFLCFFSVSERSPLVDKKDTGTSNYSVQSTKNNPERKFAFFYDFKKPGAIVSEPKLSMRIYRWQANLNMIFANPYFGVGAGQYQRNLKEYYGSMDVPDARTDRKDLYDIETHEPFTFSWFFVTACETGIPGLMAVFIFLGQLLVRAAGFGRPKCLLASGVMACFVLLLMVGLWTSPMVRGAGPLLGLLLAVSAIQVRQPEEQDTDCCV